MGNKSILVMNTPVSCEDCIISYENDYRNICSITGAYHNTANERPNWCPLKQMPEKKNFWEEEHGGKFSSGWNACIDEITGGDE